MTPDEIRAEIDRVCKSHWEVELAPLEKRLRLMDSATVFHNLFQFAAHSQEFGPAAPAALLLRRINPPCPIACRAAIQELLIDWDISIEEVPFYLAEQFGVATVKAAIADLRTSHSEHTALRQLDTIFYWLGCYEQMQKNDEVQS